VELLNRCGEARPTTDPGLTAAARRNDFREVTAVLQTYVSWPAPCLFSQTDRELVNDRYLTNERVGGGGACLNKGDVDIAAMDTLGAPSDSRPVHVRGNRNSLPSQTR
jgi:hypothetical protein